MNGGDGIEQLIPTDSGDLTTTTTIIDKTIEQ